jgi:hypothetical protein
VHPAQKWIWAFSLSIHRSIDALTKCFCPDINNRIVFWLLPESPEHLSHASDSKGLLDV